MTDVRYERPTTLAAACALLAECAGDVAPLAGGTDLLVKLRAGQLKARLFVDLKAIPELCELRWTPDGDLMVGAAVTMRQLQGDVAVASSYPALAEAAGAVGSVQVRERATVGGNLCNASPCMDTAPPLLLLDASVLAVSTRGEREIPLASFFADVKRTCLAPDEIVTEIAVPSTSKSRATAFGKLKRLRGHDLALVNAAVAYEPQQRTLRAAIGSCTPTPVMTETLSVDPQDAAAAGAKLAAAAARCIHPIDDLRASAEYRRDMAAHLCRRLATGLLSDVRRV